MSLIIPANTLASGGFAVANSARFNSGSSDRLIRTQTAGNRRTYTISWWMKRSGLSASTSIIGSDPDGSHGANFSILDFKSSDELDLSENVSGSTWRLITNRKFRDVSAWYHIVFAVDTTQGTSSNRLKLYINGVQETSFSTENYPSQNLETKFNENSNKITVGGRSGQYVNGYFAEVVMIDGTALDPTSFGEFDSDSNIWKPISVSGLTFGTNGFYLDFENSGALGADVSGNTNNFTVNNLTAIDQTTDTPTNNFATMNPLDNIGATTFSEGNNLLLWTATNKTNKSTIGVTSGKWYAECKAIDVNGGTSGTLIGVGTEANLASTYLSATTSGWGYRCQTGYIQNGAGNEAYGDTWVENDIIGVALDMDNGAVYMSKNGTFQDSGDPTSGASKTNAANNQPSYGSAISGTLFFACSSYDTDSLAWNFGNAPYTISSGNTDGNGYGNFEYAPPSGYLSLCTANLSESG